ncbi:acetyl-CoA carboxylase biotin carboxyl carrier protein subunit [Aureibaculum marinum]|uniref:Acetyl-CoA carboxylase biotin carboxyl carrier protein subunit n=1 Tax=Aureibaculum marinum TaxID=2487930 RepID=A0A3N4NZF8_9FLAO|nr:acetyl-CoA carboxylase biotin carboxyl carrier protein subunit [Aureibaculum marinum]RPD99608.1 acetyl-CoA carboxylase biotin carboxyl carrier protein subunit [Aureibaculum marinum]
MSNTYKVIVNDTEEFNISNKDIISLNVIENDTNKYHLLDCSKPYHIEILESNFNKKQYVIIVNRNKYEVAINDNLDQLIKEMGFSSSSTKNVDYIKAPMPGLILEVNVKAGQEVKENDPLLILEAMKMENIITSPRKGTIKSVTAVKGNTVEKGNMLIEFES